MQGATKRESSRVASHLDNKLNVLIFRYTNDPTNKLERQPTDKYTTRKSSEVVQYRYTDYGSGTRVYTQLRCDTHTLRQVTRRHMKIEYHISTFAVACQFV